MSGKNNRDKITDIAKGIGILLVVCMHSNLPFLSGLDMPLFFLISGFFAPTIAKYTLWGGVKRKTISLLIPSFKYIVFFGILSFFLPKLPLSQLVQQPFWYFLTPEQLLINPLLFQPNQYFAFTLWFVSALWMGMLLWLLFRYWIEPRIESPVFSIWLALCLIALYYSSINGPTLWKNVPIGCLDRALYAFVFIVFGFLLYRYRTALLYGKFRWIVFLLGIIAIYWKIRYWNHLPIADVKSMKFDDFYKTRSIFVSFCGIACVFSASIVITKFQLVAKFFDYIGEKSFHIMVLHPLGIFLFSWLLRILDVFQDQGDYSTSTKIGCLLSGLMFSLFCIKIWDWLCSE